MNQAEQYEPGGRSNLSAQAERYNTPQRMITPFHGNRLLRLHHHTENQ
jgi:hypothetical protein